MNARLNKLFARLPGCSRITLVLMFLPLAVRCGTEVGNGHEMPSANGSPTGDQKESDALSAFRAAAPALVADCAATKEDIWASTGFKVTIDDVSYLVIVEVAGDRDQLYFENDLVLERENGVIYDHDGDVVPTTAAECSQSSDAQNDSGSQPQEEDKETSSQVVETASVSTTVERTVDPASGAVTAITIVGEGKAITVTPIE